MTTKKYFWLKLKEDFFDDKYIKALRKLPDGESIVIVYLKMQLKSLKTEGFIKYDRILPSQEEELALILDEDVNIVRYALAALTKMKLIENWDNDTLYMAAMQNLIGSESAVAERVRKHREKQKLLQCNSDETKGNTYIEIEKEIELDTEKKKKNTKSLVVILDEAIEDNSLKKIFNEFIEMRKTIKKPLTARALELLINRLNKLTTNTEEQKEILEQSIMNCWQNIYPLKTEINNKANGGNEGEEYDRYYQYNS